MAKVARIVTRIAGICVAVAVLVPTLAILYARTDRGRETVRRIALAQARKTVPGLAIGRIEGDYVHALSLRDVEVRDRQGRTAVHVDRLALRYRLLSLVRRTVAVDELRVEGVRLCAAPDPEGGMNLAHLTAPPRAEPAKPAAGPSPPSAWRVHVDKLAVSDVTGTIEMADGTTGALGGFRIDGGMRLDGARFRTWIDGLAAGAVFDDRSYALSLAGAEAEVSPSDVAVKVPSLRLAGALPGEAPIELAAEGVGPHERIEAKVDLRLGREGVVTIRGRAGLVPNGRGGSTLGAYDVALRAADIDPARLVEGGPEGRLAFMVSARGDGAPLSRDARARIDLEILASRLAGVRIEHSRLAATSDGDRWQVPRATVRASGATLALAARGVGARLAADLQLALDGPAMRPAGVDVQGRGQVALHVEGTAARDLVIRSRGDLRRLRVQTLSVGALTLALDAQAKAPGPPSGSLRLGARRVVIPAAPPIDAFSLEAAGSPGGNLRVHAAVVGPRLHGGLQAHGTADAAGADVSLDGLSVDFTTRAYRQKLDLERPAQVRYRAGDGVAIEHLAVRGQGAKFTGEAIVGGEYRLPPARRDPIAQLTAALRGASVGGLAPTDAHLEATLLRRRVAVRLDAAMPTANAQLHLDADLPVRAAAGSAPRLAPHGRAAVNLKSNQVKLQALPVIQRQLARQGITGGTASIDLTVSGDIAHPDAQGTFDVKDIMYRNIAGLGRDSTLKTVPGLGGSLKIDTRPGDIRLGARLFIRNTGVLDADLRLPVDLGRIIAGADPRTLPLRASVVIPRFSLASLADFTDGLKGVEGQLTGNITVSGTLRRPSGRADLAVEGAVVDKVRFRKVEVHGAGDEGHIEARLDVVQESGGRLDGSLALERAHGDRLRAFLTGKDLDVGFARVFLRNVREIGGVAQLSVTAAGSTEAPRLNASLSLDKGRLGVVGQPTFQDVHVDASLAPGRGDLHRIAMRSGGGTLDGKGWVILGGASGLSPRQATFTAHAHRFLVATAGSSGARVDGDLAASAVLREDLLSGKVEIPDANVWLPKGPPTGGGRDLQKIGQHGDVHFVDATALAAVERDRVRRQEASASALRLAVKARAQPIYIRGKDLDIEVRSSIEIGTVASGPHAGAPTISGGLHIPRGRINIQGQRFDFDHGNVRFNGSDEINPELDLKLTRQYPEAMVVIELQGTPKKPRLRLTSDPAIYDQAQIVSLILTGEPGGQPSSGKSFDPTAAVATAVLSRLADQVAPALGLDVLRVEGQDVKNAEGEATGDTDTRVEVGKYITERIYLSYAHVFGAPDTANQNEAHVEYRMTRRMMMETVFGDAGQGGVDALWTYRF